MGSPCAQLRGDRVPASAGLVRGGRGERRRPAGHSAGDPATRSSDHAAGAAASTLRVPEPGRHGAGARGSGRRGAGSRRGAQGHLRRGDRPCRGAAPEAAGLVLAPGRARWGAAGARRRAARSDSGRTASPPGRSSRPRPHPNADERCGTWGPRWRRASYDRSASRRARRDRAPWPASAPPSRRTPGCWGPGCCGSGCTADPSSRCWRSASRPARRSGCSGP